MDDNEYIEGLMRVVRNNVCSGEYAARQIAQAIADYHREQGLWVVQDWMPIEEAPKDGRKLLVATLLADDKTWEYGIAKYRLDCGGLFVEQSTMRVGWTHYCEFIPPTDAAKGESDG